MKNLHNGGENVCRNYPLNALDSYLQSERSHNIF